MSLDSGMYIITTVADNRHVGRFPIEDRSLRPKEVFALPQNIDVPRLIVEKNDKGYKIKAGGAPTGTYVGFLFAFLLDNPEPEDWVICAQPQHGENVFTVEKQDRSKGWVRGDEEDHRGFKIKIEPLKSGKSEPPKFPPTELFVFTRIDRD